MYGQVLTVDAGGYFPETDLERDLSWFQMDAMKMIGVDVAGVGDRDLRFGISYLRETARGKKLPLVSANLLDAGTGRPALDPYRVTRVGGVTVGVFGLISDKVDLGPSRDSLKVDAPVATAKRVVAELRKKGATVVVLLSQLGKVETEDLVTEVPGIDAAIAGRNVPLLQKGRMVGSTVVAFGGEQGQYLGRTVLTLGSGRRVTSGENEMVMLGPEVGEQADVAAVVKTFEDSFNAKKRVLEKEQAAARAAQVLEQSADRFVGGEVCARCHADEAKQWATTAHARAFDTLVRDQKENVADCVPCHVVGFKEPGGYVTAQSSPQMTHVQCESCHGMGTKHEAYAAKRRPVGEDTCVRCHNAANDPDFDYAAALPKVLHGASGR